MRRFTSLNAVVPWATGRNGGTAAAMSTVAGGMDGSTPYPVPLSLLPSNGSLPLVSSPISSSGLNYAITSPVQKWDHRPRRDILNTHVTTSLPPVELLRAINDIASYQHSLRTPLQNQMPQVNTYPPEPEKPKWEEEQLPDVGKTIDIVSNHLPFLLIQPLPPNILSSKIEVRLFPSTYPNIPTLRLSKFAYRTFFRTVRWWAPVFLNRSLRSFGRPSGVKGVGLEITCLRVTEIENGRRIEARWRTSSSPWTAKPETSAPTNTAEDMPQTWSGWFYFDIDRKGKIIRHIIENVNNQRKVEGADNKLKDILARTVVSNGRRLGEGFGSVGRPKIVEGAPATIHLVRDWIPRLFPPPSASNIFVTARSYC